LTTLKVTDLIKFSLLQHLLHCDEKQRPLLDVEAADQPQFFVKEILRHEHLSTTNRYSHSWMDTLTKLVAPQKRGATGS
jgi:hypothetical protein